MIGAALTLGVSGTPLRAQPSTDARRVETVRAERFELVSSDGRVYAVLGNLGYQGITSPYNGLAFLDSEGRPIIAFGLGPEYDPIIASWQIESGRRPGEQLKRGTRVFHVMGGGLELTASNDRDSKGQPRVVDPTLEVNGFENHGVVLTIRDGKGVVLTR
jgi:hypothetical protein